MRISRRIDRFKLDRALIGLLLLGAAGFGLRGWLQAHPEHNPWAPLELDHPIGWATRGKLMELRANPEDCRAMFARSGVAFTWLEPTGEGACRREDRMILTDAPLMPARAQATCAVAAGFEMWMRHGVEPAASEILGSRVVGIEHLGTYNCRRMNGSASGAWSEHATGNAIDIAAFDLADGRRISLQGDWADTTEEAQFLRRVRDSACDVFATVLSPDYNAAHEDHLHFDQANRSFGSACR